jgi:hypothetical protein
VAFIAATPTVSAEPWPSRAIKVISPSTAGNAADTVARIVLDQVSRQVGQAFAIEPRPGAGGTAAAEFVAKAEPDGYTAGIELHSMSVEDFEKFVRDDVAATRKLAKTRIFTLLSSDRRRSLADCRNDRKSPDSGHGHQRPTLSPLDLGIRDRCEAEGLDLMSRGTSSTRNQC